MTIAEVPTLASNLHSQHSTKKVNESIFFQKTIAEVPILASNLHSQHSSKWVPISFPQKHGKAGGIAGLTWHNIQTTEAQKQKVRSAYLS